MQHNYCIDASYKCIRTIVDLESMQLRTSAVLTFCYSATVKCLWLSVNVKCEDCELSESDTNISSY